MELRQLKTFVAVVDHGSFVAAGEYIGLTQSAISLQIKALEQEFDTPLFDRSSRPATLNARGRILLERAREILDYCAEVKDAVVNDELSGSLELGAVPTSLTGILPSALAALKDTHPLLHIKVTSGPSNNLAEYVSSGKLDVAVVTKPSGIADGLIWTAFAREPLMVIAPKDNAETTDKNVLESRPYIQFNTRTWAGQQIEQHLKDRKIRVVRGMEIDSLEAIALMVSNGLGVSVIPLRCGEEKVPFDLKCVPFGDPPQYRTLGLLQREANSRLLLSQALLETLKELCRKSPLGG
jgi:DNA-binding transcriptional LysR family regulator